jgi:hypothetical protein
MIGRFDSLVQEALASTNHEGTPLNLGRVSHLHIIRLLRLLCYNAQLQEKSLPICYSESTQISYIPLGRLATCEEAPVYALSNFVMRYGGMTQRHYTMDYFVDSYLVLNSRISRRGLMSIETERTASQMAYEYLIQSAKAADWVRLFTSGLQPVTVGIMITIEKLLFESRSGTLPRFTVEPMELKSKYFDSQLNDSEAITSESPGAKEEHYQPMELWY